MSFRRSLMSLALFGSLALLGFGCKKVDMVSFVDGNAPANARVVLPTLSVNTGKPQTASQPRVAKDRTADPNVLKARDAMISFNKSQSFRASITVGGPEGIKGEVSFNQTGGMYGTLTLSNGMKADIAVQEPRVAVRSGGAAWQEVTNTDEATQIIEIFKIVSNRTDDEPTYPTKMAKLVSVADDPTRGCRMYNISQFMGDRGYQPVQVCTKGELPVYLSVPSEDGLIEINYKDIDQAVNVFFPIP